MGADPLHPSQAHTITPSSSLSVSTLAVIANLLLRCLLSLVHPLCLSLSIFSYTLQTIASSARRSQGRTRECAANLARAVLFDNGVDGSVGPCAQYSDAIDECDCAEERVEDVCPAEWGALAEHKEPEDGWDVVGEECGKEGGDDSEEVREEGDLKIRRRGTRSVVEGFYKSPSPSLHSQPLQ